MNKKLEKGITLIALIITIIVLLILAGVTIATLTGENGLLNKATTARDATEKAEMDEKVKLAVLASIGTDGKVNLAEVKEELDKQGVEGTIEDGTLKVTTDNKEYTITENGTIGEETITTPSEPTTPYTAYNIGDEVTVGGESFYVLEASDGNTENVTLISKYNLNKEGTAQSNATYSDTACEFSSTNYWSSDFTSSPFDLNDLGKESTGDAIAKAKSYATNKGATSGRLLTHNEADALKTSISTDTTGKIAKMLWGTEATNGYLNFWLGSAYGTYHVWGVYGEKSRLDFDGYDSGLYFGVRPVITISKSLIS